jgi:hypothetical protein
MPIVESEVCYERIMATCRQDLQRFMFWTTVLNGCCGFTYGANGIWQVNRSGQPYGPSPHGRSWGSTPWDVAMNYPGGAEVGVGTKILRELPWQRFEPHPEWVEPTARPETPLNPSAAGIPRELRVIYTPTMWDPPTIRQLEPDIEYTLELINPGTAERIARGILRGDADGAARPSLFPEQRDWLLVLRAVH